MVFFDQPVSTVLRDLATKEEGLTTAQADERLRSFGPNDLVVTPPRHWLSLLASQFANPVVWVLLVALLISLVADSHVDALVILIIVIINALLGFIQERKAEHSIAALKKTLGLKATVLREGKETILDATLLVPGDIILLESGTKVPADARLCREAALTTQEGPLTGESTLVAKHTATVKHTAALADRNNMIYAGTVIATGRGRAIVTATGMKTEIGRIATLIRDVPQEPTRLQRRLVSLSAYLTILVVIVASLVFAAGIIQGIPTTAILLTAVALAVAAIPESLPTVVTLALALGVQKMARRNALIRRLPSVETLGTCTIICTDKTGTLTHDQMTVRELYLPHRTLAVSGTGYAMDGHIDGDGHGLLLTIGALCNNASLRQENGEMVVVGDPTEAALFVSAAKGRLSSATLSLEQPRISELQFTPERKRMTTIHERAMRRIAYTKGAPDVVLDLCTHKIVNGKVTKLTDLDRKAIIKANADMARRAMRVLAFAYRQLDADEHITNGIERDLIFVGLQGMIDPPRPEVIDAIKTAQAAGIRVIMVTGDHPLTALAIAREVGIPGKMMTGEELAHALDPATAIADVGIFARVDPAHKLLLVEAYKKRGEIVAMTGDGINDAPALKKADIGIAMGKSGTDVAREASDMVLADDNFATIIHAIRGGRTVMDNIIKFVTYVIGTNLAEIFIVFFALIIGLPLPVTAIMLLWINLLADGPAAIALSLEKPEPGIMTRKPLASDATILTRPRISRMLSLSVLLAISTLGLFIWGLRINTTHAQTLVFTALALSRLTIAFSYRSERVPITKLGIFTNTWLLGAVMLSFILQVIVVQWAPLHAFFGTIGLGFAQWCAAAGVAIVLLLFDQLIIATRPTSE